ncbi:methyltransferase, FkbM family [Pseudorhodobacter antarcticus]|jgi:FkbM family methyltransferase|uniref:Methyltransferase, FkbM family n=1 Tax=Pseudorhodobacter antarcticus TaxID=1077947 RepID=A0A1H8BJI0_9RHOB|nr:FkbM family methyltransferase [Pseudorhodobacter antarcticus]SEM82218.1 methyltransferase, FkbM family [Pseudorhodobacter antarcticus]
MSAFVPIDLDAARAGLGAGVVTFPPLGLTRSVQWGRAVVFCTRDVPDPILRNHQTGQFYEAKDLRALRPYFPKGGVFVDIGANVGNHSLFAALFLHAAKVVPVEPNPVSYTLLLANIVANGLVGTFDLRGLGIGASDRAAGGFAMEVRTKNVGAAKMLPGEGDINVQRGDDILAGLVPNMIKIDVEGMEIEVLAGLEETVAAHKPVMLIEVDTRNDAAFLAWVKAHHYDVAQVFVRYKTNKNYLITAAA